MNKLQLFEKLIGNISDEEWEDLMNTSDELRKPTYKKGTYTDKNWQDIFKKEFEYIDDPEVIDICIYVLDCIVDEYHKSASASFTGKYHPITDLGPDGLVHHTKAVVQFLVENLKTLEDKKLNDKRTDPLLKYKDLLIGAAILHDMAKFPNGTENWNEIERKYKENPEDPSFFNKYTNSYQKPKYPKTAGDHSRIMKNDILNNVLNLGIFDKEKVSIIAELVGSHMGKWTTSKYFDGELDNPEDESDELLKRAKKTLCNADFNSSRSFIDMVFDEEGNILKSGAEIEEYFKRINGPEIAKIEDELKKYKTKKGVFRKNIKFETRRYIDLLLEKLALLKAKTKR